MADGADCFGSASSGRNDDVGLPALDEKPGRSPTRVQRRSRAPGTHRLDRRPELPDKFTLADALNSMAGHVIGRARLDGTYEIR